MTITQAQAEQLVTDLVEHEARIDAIVNGADDATVVIGSGEVPTIAKAIKDASARIDTALQATSASSLTIGTGEKIFAIEAEKAFSAGQTVVAVDAANAGNWMLGQIASYIGTTLTLDVTNIAGAGTIADWRIFLSGVRGPQGEQGEQGEQGVPGADGADGAPGADGKSAYEIAVDEGFVGDEAAWLASLEGAQGPQGIQGETGTFDDSFDDALHGERGGGALHAEAGGGSAGFMSAADKAALDAVVDGNFGLPTDFSAVTPALDTPQVTIGTNNPNGPVLGFQASGNMIPGCRVDALRSRGSIASPTVMENGDVVLAFNATPFDGTYYRQTGAFRFFVDGIPSSGVSAPTRLTLHAGTTSATERLRVASDGVVRPGADNTQDFGASAFRWKELYCGNATINTSDAREKEALRVLDTAERAVARRLASEIGIFRWMAAVAKKGASARLHIGVTAQRVQEVFAAEGLDGFRYGVLCHDAWQAEAEIVDESTGEVLSAGVEAGDRFGIRYEQLMLWIAVGFEERLSALEGS